MHHNPSSRASQQHLWTYIRAKKIRHVKTSFSHKNGAVIWRPFVCVSEKDDMAFAKRTKIASQQPSAQRPSDDRQGLACRPHQYCRMTVCILRSAGRECCNRVA
ncbi:hypothetical protein BAUCODRAFT_274500 [Baudoinia panamericana UAMH 10762]|uniref:Uncharacterized protein n=1 Tax=Baudoinia panamericana (strain UAMH 10762) TaxID=717646 RepID=M2LDJ0_BAUPA|nr:uncharacterized protein BAUCODRAFT_274500 [Baudoinia panamericana UAMH 10762]EMC92037.1 hypothetical protein BAUCODRAFT_274500 [Baudoinia panamericana UAMH 10762]